MNMKERETITCPACHGTGEIEKGRRGTKQAAQKIVGFTGYGQSLHVNDILPDLNELLRQEFLALAEEIEAKTPNPDWSVGAIKITADIIRSKADELK